MIERLINKLNSISSIKPNTFLVEKFETYQNHYIGIDNEKNVALLINNINSQNKIIAAFKGKNLCTFKYI